MNENNKLHNWFWVHFQMIDDKQIFGLVFTDKEQADKGIVELSTWKNPMLEIHELVDGKTKFELSEREPISVEHDLVFSAFITVEPHVKSYPSYLEFLRRVLDKRRIYVACLFQNNGGVLYTPHAMKSIFPLLSCTYFPVDL